MAGLWATTTGACLNDLRTMSGDRLATARTFDDPRLASWCGATGRATSGNPHARRAGTLEAHRAACLFDGQGGAHTVGSCLHQIDEISLAETADDERTQDILGALYDYAGTHRARKAILHRAFLPPAHFNARYPFQFSHSPP